MQSAGGGAPWRTRTCNEALASERSQSKRTQATAQKLSSIHHIAFREPRSSQNASPFSILDFCSNIAAPRSLRITSKIENPKFPQTGPAYACSEETMKKKLRILGVDDEPIIGESIACALENPHRKIVIAKDGQEALALAKKEKFDVVITDHRMPRSGGLELVKKLRARKYAGKIVVLSGHLSPDNIGIYEELDVDEVVGKPINSAELRELIVTLEEDIEMEG